MSEGKLYFSIKEVSKELEVTYTYLRFLERNIEQLKIHKNKAGTRFYTKENIQQISKIKYLTKELGLSVKSAANQVYNNDSLLLEKVELIQSLHEIRNFLVELKKLVQQSKRDI